MEGVPWGGSEELWSRAAAMLRRDGFPVSVSIKDWGSADPASARALEGLGVNVLRRQAPRPMPFAARMLHRLGRRVGLVRQTPSALDQLADSRPALTVISSGGGIPPLGACQPFIASNLPFAILIQAAAEQWWPDDSARRDALLILRAARAVYFVSEGNRRLTRRQLAFEHQETHIVANPFQASQADPMPWPGDGPLWRLAVVGRLDPMAKGCDLLIEALAAPVWRERPVEVTFFGDGVSAEGVRAHADMLRLPHIHFAGWSNDIAGIWRSHHALVLTSRFEGLPLAVVEAMYCGRPCLVTDVGGNSELIEDGVTGFIAPYPSIPAVAAMLERAWRRRLTWREMGLLAASDIRRRIPRDPVRKFVTQLQQLASKAS